MTGARLLMRGFMNLVAKKLVHQSKRVASVLLSLSTFPFVLASASFAPLIFVVALRLFELFAIYIKGHEVGYYIYPFYRIIPLDKSNP
jgi:hypothetical protein